MSRDVKDGDRVATTGESFLQRFHRRKTEARQHIPEPVEPGPDILPGEATELVANEDPAPPARPALTDADMPPLESLGEDSDYTGFLSEQVSETLRKAALRKLFHSATFNITDGLDEYADDFTTFEALGDIITADMRHMIEVEARKKAEQVRQAALSADTGTDGDMTESASTTHTTTEPDDATGALEMTSETSLLSGEPAPVDATPSRTTES